MSETEQNRSEAATPYKLMRSREKGVVARGVDLGFFAALAAVSGYALVAGPRLFERVVDAAQGALVSATSIVASPDALLTATAAVFLAVVQPIAFMTALTFLVVAVIEFIQTGPVFSTEPLRPDLGRLSPARGFKRVFSFRLLVETAKNIVKLAAYAAVAYLVLREIVAAILPSITDARSLAHAFQSAGVRLVLSFVVVAALVAVLDQLIARRDFLRRMMMSRRELRRELRDREGDPRMKRRRQRIHRDFVKLSQSLRGVRNGDLLITNPTHLAVALQYDPQTMPAPRVVAQGAHAIAQRLKRLAFVYGLVIVENPPLARALFQRCELDEYIPEEFYRPVADIYLAIRRRQATKASA